MTRPNRIFWFLVSVGMAISLLPGRAAAQSGTVTDDAFLSTNSTTQQLNLNGQGISLIVAGSSVAVGQVRVGTTTTYIKFQLLSSLPPNTPAANVAKATLKLYLSPLTAPSGSIDIYPITSSWTESTLSNSSPPTLAATPINSAPIVVGMASSFLVIDLTSQVQEWLTNGGPANDGIALVPHTSTSYVVFDSKEDIVTSHEPRLEIVLTDAGPQGAAGPQGPQGPQGSQGAQGAQGMAATIKVEPTMNVPFGTPASVMNAGTPNAADLTFLIPQGPTGMTGPQGSQGPVGINNRNMWVSGTPYNPDDAVSYNNSFWLATAADNGSQPPPGNPNWQLLAAGINNRGAWSASSGYNVNDAVSDAGSYWLAMAPTNGTATPSTSCEPSQAGCSADWQLLAAQGQTGATGPQGAQGTQGLQGLMGMQGPPGQNPVGAAITTTANTFTTSQTISGNLILSGLGAGVQFADGTIQTTAASSSGGGGSSCPIPAQISSSSPIVPPGYTLLSSTRIGNNWSPAPPMPTARQYLAAAIDPQGNIYAIGGFDAKGQSLNTVEVYNPTTQTWRTAPPMPTARFGLAAATDTQGNVYAIGGSSINAGVPGGNPNLNTVEVFNPATQTWSTAPPMPTGRAFLAAAADLQGNIYAIGGGSAAAEFGATTVEVFSPTTQTWSTTASLATPRFHLAAAADSKGNIYAIGGANINGLIFAGKIEVYSPATQSWSNQPDGSFQSPQAVSELAATADGKGNIYELGGSDPNGVVTIADIFTPIFFANGSIGGVWNPVATMPSARSGLAAAADSQGNIYAIGGNVANVGVSNTVDMYQFFVTIYTYVKE